MADEPRAGAPLPPDLPAQLAETEMAAVDWARLVRGRTITGSLDDPDLDDVEIDGCRLERVRMIGGRIARGVVTDSEITGCDLSGVDLPDARWERVTATNTRLAGCSFSGGFWLDIDMVGGSASRLALRFATLRRVRFSGCDLAGLDLTGATLDNVAFESCALAGAHVAQLVVKRASFVDCALDGASGVEALRGASVDVPTVQSLGGAMAAALGIRVR